VHRAQLQHVHDVDVLLRDRWMAPAAEWGIGGQVRDEIKQHDHDEHFDLKRKQP